MAEFSHLLVTGGAGFIGSHYVRHVLTARPGSKVTVLDKLTYAGNLKNLDDVRDRITFVRGDISEPRDVQAAIKGADAVVNFAAESHVDRSLTEGRPFVRTNVEGTLVLLDASRAAGVKRFLHVSTDEVYGDLDPSARPSLETDPFHPRSPYAATKAAAEHLVFSYGISYGMDVVVTRGSNTYGSHQYPEKIIPLFITNAMDGKPLPLYGDGSAVRDYLHATDHAAGIDLVLREGQSARAYNLGADRQISGREVAKGILDALAKPQDLMKFVPDRPGHDYRYQVDSSAAQALGWKRRRDFAEALVETVKWYVQNEPWWRPIKESQDFRSHHKTWYDQRK